MSVSDILRAIADQLEADGYAPKIATDRPAPPAGPPAGVDPIEWARQNPDLARAYTMMTIHKMIGGASVTRGPADEIRERNLRLQDEEYQKRYWPGNVDIRDLGEPDSLEFRAHAAYIANMASPFKLKTGKNILFDGVIGGWTPDLLNLRNTGEAWANNYPAADYHGVLRPVVEQMMGE